MRGTVRKNMQQRLDNIAKNHGRDTLLQKAYIVLHN